MSGTRPIVTTGVTLAAIAAICTGLVAATYKLTENRIAENEKYWLEQSLQPALAGVFFDGGVTESKVVLQPPHDLPGNEAAIVYRVYSAGEPVAALFVVTARDGYAGPIRVLVGVRMDGGVTGVRIVSHRETPGLGDRIDQSRSDWVYQFDGRSLGNPDVGGWALEVDGGDFDQLTGASVTPRAVIKAIRETLLYFDAHREAIFALPATEEPS